MRKQGSLRWLAVALLLFTPIASRADAVNEWQGSNVSGGAWLTSATFGNGAFFVTTWSRYGPDSQLYTSTNGLNWQVSSFPGYARGIAIVDGNFIVVGAKTNNTALIMTSTDGTNWADVPGPTNIWLNGVCYGDGKYVAWGQTSNSGPSVTLVSSNALDWLTYTNLQPYQQPYFNNMTFGDGTFAGTTGPLGEGLYFLVYTSTNGFIWTQRTAPILYPGSGIAFGNHVFVGPYVISTNGVDFYHVSIPTYGITTVTYGNGTFFAAGWDGSYATSTNGFDWNAYGNGPWGWDEYMYNTPAAFGNSRFIVCEFSNIYRSGDVSVPRLSGRRAPPGFGLSLKGEINRPYHVEISDDLQNWSELMTVTNPLPITEYVDPTPIDSTNRFYRAYLQR